MARDYSSRRNETSSKNGKRRSNKPKPAATPSKRGGGGTPGWVWMICGLCIGLMIAAGFYIFARPAGSPAGEAVDIPLPDRARSTENDGSGAPDTAEPVAPPEPEEPRYDFYRMLKDHEVVIPEEQYPERESQTGNNATPSEPGRPTPTTPTVSESGRFIIQAGSFSARDDAERRKAELGLLGLAAGIVEVQLESGRTVYRVQSERIDSRDALNDMLRRLDENRIDTLVMRARDN